MHHVRDRITAAEDELRQAESLDLSHVGLPALILAYDRLRSALTDVIDIAHDLCQDGPPQTDPSRQRPDQR